MRIESCLATNAQDELRLCDGKSLSSEMIHYVERACSSRRTSAKTGIQEHLQPGNFVAMRAAHTCMVCRHIDGGGPLKEARPKAPVVLLSQLAITFSSQLPHCELQMLQAVAQSRVLPARPARAAASNRLRARRAVITAVAEKDTGVGERDRQPEAGRAASGSPGCGGTRESSFDLK